MTGEEIGAMVAPRLEAEGFELYDVEDAGGVLRVLVDRPGGIDLDAVAAATRVVSDAIDEADALAGPTTLEVSSPGLERPLRTPAHYARAVGNRVNVKTVPGTEGERRLEGTLVEADEDGFTVEGDGGVRAFGYSEVERARTVFEWGGQPRPGGPKGSKASAKRPKGAAQTQRGTASS
jgi:ribosome maturation factor RimP